MDKNHFFAVSLLEWATAISRPLAWKGEKNPYFIWLSEVLLQQTRAEQGRPYYERFIKAFPKIEDLAAAAEDQVFKLWEGLGYYNRARNLHFTAKYVVEKYNGIFPNTYEEIRQLKGVGDYTAAAIASFAFDLPRAVLDGNVYRVLSRFFGIKIAIDSNEGKKEFAKLAQKLLADNAPAAYNQAIMDFGAVHCKPKNPLCATCLHNTKCEAFAQKLQAILPIKSKKIKHKERYFYYVIYRFEDKILLNKREEKDIWQGLYDFPLLELAYLEQKENLIENADFQQFINKNKSIKSISEPYYQQLTHQKIIAFFIEIELKNKTELDNKNWKWIENEQLKDYANPKIITNYLENQHLSLF